MIYLDNANTSWPKPPQVAEAMTRYLREVGVSPGRGAYAQAAEAQRLVADTRRKLVNLVGGSDPDRLIFGLNCTDALNMAIKGTLGDGDHVVTTTLEHNSVSRPLQRLADAGVISLTRVEPDGGGFIDPEAVSAALRPRTRLVACTHASNVLGTIQPIEEIGRLVCQREALFLVDAAQSAGVLPIDVERQHIDLLALSGHKSLLGPAGTGMLYVGPRASLRPWREGGTGGDSASPVQPGELPTLLEAGTPNTVGIAGLGAALDTLTPAETLEHERRLLGRLVEAIADLPGVQIVGELDPWRRTGTLSILVDGYSPEEAAAVLDESFGIAVRGGLHCAPYAHRSMGTFPGGTVRVAPGPTTTTEDIDALIAALARMTA